MSHINILWDKQGAANISMASRDPCKPVCRRRRPRGCLSFSIYLSIHLSISSIYPSLYLIHLSISLSLSRSLWCWCLPAPTPTVYTDKPTVYTADIHGLHGRRGGGGADAHGAPPRPVSQPPRLPPARQISPVLRPETGCCVPCYVTV